MSQSHRQSTACHNCRKRRLKCDQALPQCSKCIKRGQACLGYGRLFRWEQGIASRGKMAGKTFPPPPQLPDQTGVFLLSPSLTEPLLQDIDYDSRRYLLYFASDVCRDLVLYDAPKRNPFRELIPLALQHPILLQVIIANSALHMSNTCQKSLFGELIGSSPSCYTSPSSSSSSSSLSTQQYQSYNDALVAKQRALHLLKSNLSMLDSVDLEVTLAVVLLFIEFELIDTGRDDWKHHVDGARTVIETLCRPKILKQTVMSPLRSCLISNCLVFDILGSSLASSLGPPRDHFHSTGAMTLLRDEEGNHCSSFPTALLQLIQLGACLSQPSTSTSFLNTDSDSDTDVEEALRLLSLAYSFDPSMWAKDIQARSPVNDVVHRTHVAHGHRAAVCIYLSHVALSIDSSVQLPQDLESLVTDIITHLSYIRPHDALFTATTWPAFIAGAEANDASTQEWVVRRFQELWEVEPWGLMRGALEVLQRIWSERTSAASSDAGNGRIPSNTNPRRKDWVSDLRSRGVDWLIL